MGLDAEFPRGLHNDSRHRVVAAAGAVGRHAPFVVALCEPEGDHRHAA